eukprot:5146972-Lingulodinium_polyedra.AAC.1
MKEKKPATASKKVVKKKPNLESADVASHQSSDSAFESEASSESSHEADPTLDLELQEVFDKMERERPDRNADDP